MSRERRRIRGKGKESTGSSPRISWSRARESTARATEHAQEERLLLLMDSRILAVRWRYPQKQWRHLSHGGGDYADLNLASVPRGSLPASFTKEYLIFMSGCPITHISHGVRALQSDWELNSAEHHAEHLVGSALVPLIIDKYPAAAILCLEAAADGTVLVVSRPFHQIVMLDACRVRQDLCYMVLELSWLFH